MTPTRDELEMWLADPVTVEYLRRLKESVDAKRRELPTLYNNHTEHVCLSGRLLESEETLDFLQTAWKEEVKGVKKDA